MTTFSDLSRAYGDPSFPRVLASWFEALKAEARKEGYSAGYKEGERDALAEAWDEGALHAAMRPDLSENPYRP